MKFSSAYLYKFIGIHSFLIGLFPFYIPVFLWKSGLPLSRISYFIALTGVGFCLTLWVWDRLRRKISLGGIITLSFLLEGALLAMIFFGKTLVFFPVFALLYGIYNCFFWTTQRVLFVQTIETGNSGKKFGNLQILVALILKSGILIGGLMLDKLGYTSVFLFSVAIVLLGILSFVTGRNRADLSSELLQPPPVSLKKIMRFKDSVRSPQIFILDGLFLFLESFFWMISMFLIVKESFMELGILVIALMIIFTLLFLVIKNTIDRLPATTFFRVSVLLYAFSWLLRGLVDVQLSRVNLFLLLVLITFFTSLFRLSFNKRFFDYAKSSSTFSYLILKSYYSQASLAVIFMVIGVVLAQIGNQIAMLSNIYYFAAFAAVGYVLYGRKAQSIPTTVDPIL